VDVAGKIARTPAELYALFNIAPPSATWAYVRVSSEKQEAEGYGLEYQTSAINEFCRAHGLAAPVIVEEVASAGKPALPISLSLPGAPAPAKLETSPRPLLLALLGHLQEQTSSQLVLWRLDRLSRLGYEQDMFVELLRRRGVRIHSVQDSESDVLSSADPAKNLLRHVLAAFAQYEKAIIQMRMQAGLRAKANRGGWAGGTVPTGYVAKNRDLVVDPPVADSIRRIFYWRFQEQMTLAEIATALTRKGSPSHTTGTVRWSRSKIHRALAMRDLYFGVYEDPYGQKHQRDDLRIVPDDIHAIPDVTDVALPA